MRAALLNHPNHIDLMSEQFLGIGGLNAFNEMWRKDWGDFGRLFYAAKAEALKEMGHREL